MMDHLHWLRHHHVIQKASSEIMSGVPKWLLVSGFTVGIGCVATVCYFYAKPERFLRCIRRTAVWRAGFSVKTIQGTKYTYSYMERGTPNQHQATMLFVHGFQSYKENWTSLVQLIPKNIHIVCVDLIGHGQTTTPTDLERATINEVAESFEEFVQLISSDRLSFHLIGGSVGGVIAALYTSRHAEHVDRLTLISPYISCPIETEIWHMTKHECFTDDPVKCRDVVLRCCYNKDVLPKSLWIYRAMITERRHKLAFLAGVSSSLAVLVSQNKDAFERVLAKISIPTQIIWGEEDEVVHVSGASLLEEIMPAVKRTDILPLCGHYVMLEQAEVTRSLILDFYNTTYSS